MFAALRYNDSTGYIPKLPPLDILYIRSVPEPYQSDWHVSLLRLVLGRRYPAIEFTNGSWASQMSSVLESPSRGNNWKCFNTATLVSANWAAVSAFYDYQPAVIAVELHGFCTATLKPHPFEWFHNFVTKQWLCRYRKLIAWADSFINIIPWAIL